jgi:hypothetical protein
VLRLGLFLGTALLVSATMISPDGLHLSGILAVGAVIFLVLPFVAWGSFALITISPTPGQSRLSSVLTFWVAASLTATGALSFIVSAMSYPRPGVVIDPAGHALIPFMPRLGIALGLLGVSMLVACGVVGAIAPVLRREAALRAAAIGGFVLFAVVYAAGCALVAG